MRVILQARTDSSRLPAKSLLPLGGRPLAILCAQRLANRGHAVTLATSEEATDDELALQARAAGVPVFRGRKDDVLSRFLGAIEDLGDSALILRATADCPMVDGDFVAILADAYVRAGAPLLACVWPKAGVLHGLSLEATTAGHLRRLAREAGSAREREHVTIGFHDRGEAAIFTDLAGTSEVDLRGTVDTLEDYLRLARLFRAFSDPVGVSWKALAERLPAIA